MTLLCMTRFTFIVTTTYCQKTLRNNSITLNTFYGMILFMLSMLSKHGVAGFEAAYVERSPAKSLVNSILTLVNSKGQPAYTVCTYIVQPWYAPMCAEVHIQCRLIVLWNICIFRSYTIFTHRLYICIYPTQPNNSPTLTPHTSKLPLCTTNGETQNLSF